MNYKFIQPVSMQVTREQYERDLREPLLAMGYKEKLYSCWMGNSCDYLVTNFNKEDNKIGCLSKSSIHRLNRYFIPEYNPELFLAIAAMTDSISPIVGEWIVYTDSMAEMCGLTAGELYRIGKLNTNTRYMRKATLQELINKFTNQKQNIMKKELTQEQFEELKNLIAPENKEKFNKLFKVNKNAIEEDLMYESLGDNIPCMIADNIFDIEDEFKPYKENYYKRSLFVPSVCDVDFVKAKKGWTLIMFNKK